MKRVDYLKEKFSIIKSLLFSRSYVVITDDDIAGHVCSDEDFKNMQNQLVLAEYKFRRNGDERAAKIVRD